MNLKTFIKCLGVAVTTIILTNLSLFALSFSGTASLVTGDCIQLYLSMLVLYNILVFFSVILSCFIFFAITLKEKHIYLPKAKKNQQLKQKPKEA